MSKDTLTAESSQTSIPQAAIPKERPGPQGGRRDLNRRERVRTLCESAEKLFLEQGIERTTIDDITKAANIAKGSFYRYFEGKEALIAHLFEAFSYQINEVVNRAGTALEKATSQTEMNAAYEILANEMSAVFVGELGLTRLYLQENRSPATPSRAPIKALSNLFTRHAIDLTHKAHAHGILRPFPAEISALAVIGILERLILAVLNEEEVGEVLEVPSAIISLVLNGLMHREGETPLFPSFKLLHNTPQNV